MMRVASVGMFEATAYIRMLRILMIFGILVKRACMLVILRLLGVVLTRTCSVLCSRCSEWGRTSVVIIRFVIGLVCL